MKLSKNLIVVVVIVLIAVAFGALLFWFNYPVMEEFKNLNIGLSPAEKMEKDVKSISSDYTFAQSEIEPVEKIKSYGSDVIPLLVQMTNDERKETRYIAYIALSGLTNRLPEQREELITYLKNGLQDSDDTIKVQTAQLLLVWGVKEAVPILIDNLDNNQVMVPSEPQTGLNYYSYIILKDFTAVDYKYNKQQWQNWWNLNKDKLIWDEQSEKFK